MNNVITNQNNDHSKMNTSFDLPEYDEAYFYDQLSELSDFFVNNEAEDEYFSYYANRIMHGVRGLINRIAQSEEARFS